ncbi:MAG: PBSX family phage terminase large subunit [Aerococcus sanguinicola]
MALIDIYTPKQIAILKRALNKDWFMMINHGAVRAGKTVIDNDLFLFELKRAKMNAKKESKYNPMFILGATSASTLQTNVIREIEDKYDLTIKFDRYGNFTLFGVYVVTTFTGSIAGLRAIRGMTSYGAYINEATLANQEVFDEIVKRCSGLGARVILDTNPDHPRHWLKVDYIDKADGERIVTNHFTIFDNSFLNQGFIENIKATTPTGTFTERGIYGRWVSGEGAIYPDFDEEIHVIDTLPDQFDRYIAGVDWGYEHKGVMMVFGVVDDVYYLIEEHVYQHKHIDEWLEIAKQIRLKYGEHIPFYCDSARPEYVDALFYAGANASNAYKAVMPGISQMGSLIKRKHLFINSQCTNFLDEINQYVWAKTGDKPVEVNDDCMDGSRYALYSDFMVLTGGLPAERGENI